VFVVQPIADAGEEALREFADVEVFQTDTQISRSDLADGLKDADYAFLLGAVRMDADLIAAAPQLKGIATMTVYPTTVDLAAATERKIPVSIIPHVIKDSTADLTAALVIACGWRLIEADKFVRAGKFRQNQSTAFLVPGLTDKTVGMVGLGEIGMRIVQRLRPFGMDFLYTKRTRLPGDQETELGVTWVPELDDVLRTSDYVVIMTTYNPSTHKLIGAAQLELMKPSAFLINAARGRIVDEPALLNALRSGQIAGAGLDVFWNEPPISTPAVNPEYFELDNVVLAPHMGSATYDVRNTMALAVVDNLRAMVNGERPPDCVNPELFGEPPFPFTDRTG
jgi:glyoxylate reductase